MMLGMQDLLSINFFSCTSFSVNQSELQLQRARTAEVEAECQFIKAKLGNMELFKAREQVLQVREDGQNIPFGRV